ncbi:hypothetical protein KIPB_012666, partial [Kipferlia bialata]
IGLSTATVNVGTLGTTAVSIQGTSVDIAGDGGSVSLASAGVTTQVQGDLEVNSAVQSGTGDLTLSGAAAADRVVFGSSIAAGTSPLTIEDETVLDMGLVVGTQLTVGDTATQDHLDVDTLGGTVSLSATTTIELDSTTVTLTGPSGVGVSGPLTADSTLGVTGSITSGVSVTSPVLLGPASVDVTLDAAAGQSVVIGSSAAAVGVAIGNASTGTVTVSGTSVSIGTDASSEVTIGNTAKPVVVDGVLSVDSVMSQAASDLTLSVETPGQYIMLDSPLSTSAVSSVIEVNAALESVHGNIDFTTAADLSLGVTGTSFLTATATAIGLVSPDGAQVVSVDSVGGSVVVGAASETVTVGQSGKVTSLVGNVSVDTLYSDSGLTVDASGNAISIGAQVGTPPSIISVGSSALPSLLLDGLAVQVGPNSNSVAIGKAGMVTNVLSDLNVASNIGTTAASDLVLTAGTAMSIVLESPLSTSLSSIEVDSPVSMDNALSVIGTLTASGDAVLGNVAQISLSNGGDTVDIEADTITVGSSATSIAIGSGSTSTTITGPLHLADSVADVFDVQCASSFTRTMTVVDITGDTVALDGSTAVTVGTTSGDVEIGHT